MEGIGLNCDRTKGVGDRSGVSDETTVSRERSRKQVVWRENPVVDFPPFWVAASPISPKLPVWSFISEDSAVRSRRLCV